VFKKLVFVALIGLGLMWGNGYDFGKFKDDVLETTGDDAAFVNGRGGADDWGD